MSRVQQKPILHGRDHAVDGVDPIPGMGGGGIQFDTEPQAGQWLYIETDGPATTPTGFGIELNDFSDGGILLYSHNSTPATSFISINEFGGDDIILQPADRIMLQGATVVTGDLTVGGSVTDISPATSARLRAGSFSHYIVQVDDTDGISFASDSWGGIFLKVLKVGPNIEYHILSGASWVADL